MALQSFGVPISASAIRNEFGPTDSITNSVSLGSYRISQTVGSLANLPLDNGIPQSGPIKFSDFYNKKLNIIVDFHSPGNNFTTRKNARDAYIANSVTVVGGFKFRPLNSSGSKVYVNVDTTLGSEKGNRNNVALRTGSWDIDTELITVVGPNGRLYGTGGDGGAGASIDGNFSSVSNGGQGSSALGVEYPTTLINQGTIFAGVGGGGAGAAGWGWTFGDTQDGCEGRQNFNLRVGGAGGAGGRGFPSGNGGIANTQTLLNSGASANISTNGTSGTIDFNGSPGSGGNTFGGNGCNRHGFAGNGGNVESDGISGSNPDGSGRYNNFGFGGQRGYAVVISPTGSLILSGNPPEGDIVNDTVL
jgi:hypothetical protein